VICVVDQVIAFELKPHARTADDNANLGIHYHDLLCGSSKQHDLAEFCENCNQRLHAILGNC
jgi:hypothetical protein